MRCLRRVASKCGNHAYIIYNDVRDLAQATRRRDRVRSLCACTCFPFPAAAANEYVRVEAAGFWHYREDHHSRIGSQDTP